MNVRVLIAGCLDWDGVYAIELGNEPDNYDTLGYK